MADATAKSDWVVKGAFYGSALLLMLMAGGMVLAGDEPVVRIAGIGLGLAALALFAFTPRMSARLAGPVEVSLPEGVRRNEATGALESEDPSMEVISERYAAPGLEGHRLVVRPRSEGDSAAAARFQVDARGRLVLASPSHPTAAWVGAGVLAAGLTLEYLELGSPFGGFAAAVGALVLAAAGAGSHVEVDPLTRTVTRLRTWFGLRFLKVFPLGDFDQVRVKRVVSRSRDSDDTTSTNISHPVSLKGPAAEVTLLSCDYAVDARLFAAKVGAHVKLPLVDETSGT